MGRACICTKSKGLKRGLGSVDWNSCMENGIAKRAGVLHVSPAFSLAHAILLLLFVWQTLLVRIYNII